jgi:sugar transferase (PEP-CTERM/EpsH1 system associated)
MRILCLTHRFPFPPNKGDKIRAFNILDYLARDHEVHVAGLIDDPGDVPLVEKLAARVAGTAFERIDGRPQALSGLRAVLTGRPITVTHFHSHRLQQRVDDLLESRPFDVVLCSSSPMAEYVFRSRHANGCLARAVKAIDLIDVDSYKWRQYAARSPWWKAWIYRYEATHLAQYEVCITQAFQQVFVVSAQEREYLPPGADASKVIPISNGVDLEYFSPVQTPPGNGSGSPSLVFTGVMDYWPNVDGVVWFAERVLPRIRAAVPDVRFVIVGSRPSEAVRKLARLDGVTVTGFVEDVRDFVSTAAVCVVPLRIARGVQNKVLEAMAMGKAVVCTPQAFEGLQAEQGVDLLTAATEDAFADAVIGLLRDRAAAGRMGENARRFVERHYRWSDHLAALARALGCTRTVQSHPPVAVQ